MTQQISWNKYVIEAVVIVGSILLAFGVDAWWERVQIRAFERQAILDLKEEFEGHRLELSSQMTTNQFSLQRTADLLQASEDGSWISDETPIDRAIMGLLAPVTTDLGEGVLDSLISGGRIEDIEDEELRYLLYEWRSVLDELTDDQDIGVTMVFNLIIPYLTKSGIPAMGMYLLETDDSFPTTVSPTTSIGRLLSEDTKAVETILTDPEFHSILEIRLGFLAHTANAFESTLEALDEIIALLNASIEQ
jgi:hypothetical protein